MDLYHLTDLSLKIAALVGGVFALKRWRVDQRWRRYQQLDKYMTSFENDRMLLLGTQILDWKLRPVKAPDGTTVTITSKDLVAALQVHTENPEPTFCDPQPLLRDALDALLTFFGRLESAIANGFVDESPALHYFGYWLCRMYTMEEHKGEDPNVQSKMRAYEQAYGPETMPSLYNRLKTTSKHGII